jgi:hypothetical protein
MWMQICKRIILSNIIEIVFLLEKRILNDEVDFQANIESNLDEGIMWINGGSILHSPTLYLIIVFMEYTNANKCLDMYP